MMVVTVKSAGGGVGYGGSMMVVEVKSGGGSQKWWLCQRWSSSCQHKHSTARGRHVIVSAAVVSVGAVVSAAMVIISAVVVVSSSVSTVDKIQMYQFQVSSNAAHHQPAPAADSVPVSVFVAPCFRKP
jgi:hypothetical protein